MKSTITAVMRIDIEPLPNIIALVLMP